MTCDETPPLTLRILVTGDLHAHLRAYDYLADQPSAGIGLAGLANDIDAARAAHEGPLLLVDAGDTLQGGLLGEMVSETDQVHPVVTAMNALGYDAAVPGNHDFEYGLPYLERAAAASDFVWVCANVHRLSGPTTGASVFLPWTLRRWTIEERELTVGILGCALPESLSWNRPVLDAELGADPMVEAAERAADELRMAGADVVLALAHTGIGETAEADQGETSALPLGRLPGIDCLVLGHTHLCFPGSDYAPREDVDPEAGTLAGTPAIMAGHSGSHLGVLDLALEAAPSGGWRVTGHRASCRAQTLNQPECPRLSALSEAAHENTRRFAEEPIGHTPCALNSHYSLLGNDAYLSCLSEALRRGARQEGVSDMARLITAVGPFRNGGRGGPLNFTEVPEGPVSRRHVSDLYPFENVLALIEADGAALHHWLESAASVFAEQWPDECPRPLLDPFVPSARFDALHGLRYEIDLGHPPFAGRVGPVRRNGAPLRPESKLLVATSAYRAESLIGSGLLQRDQVQVFPQTMIRRLLSQTLADPEAMARVVETSKEEVWRLTAPSGSIAQYDAPAAPAPTPQIGGISFEEPERTRDGFTQFELRFETQPLAFARPRAYVTP
ncbi:5'-nucleotidase C-terminal domain-containing protein [Poseidonocella sedimentorum]|uniref:2',3'-cyclic-nucleotide 2'-phosphodiesterase / 3'-nucleotidase n=1 Tax=Poseidonocella sedimentorum TaxID=871652 RepID=A0A1I6DU95_9RHOB|nr:5'-nucleotidase C-terminal domain-containing protein [Poseidonocella sedimentorum]SFR08932.1 2',3'-cyclic-nucleotide 2'-phosphodiesterase / 3'-nucleotidase [Poseidonocella sedimentorum]